MLITIPYWCGISYMNRFSAYLKLKFLPVRGVTGFVGIADRDLVCTIAQLRQCKSPLTFVIGGNSIVMIVQGNGYCSSGLRGPGECRCFIIRASCLTGCRGSIKPGGNLLCLGIINQLGTDSSCITRFIRFFNPDVQRGGVALQLACNINLPFT